MTKNSVSTKKKLFGTKVAGSLADAKPAKVIRVNIPSIPKFVKHRTGKRAK